MAKVEFDSWISIADLYNELSQRLEILASAVRAFEPNRQKRDLAAQVFQMMEHWEAAARLGRVIAVLNRRERTSNR